MNSYQNMLSSVTCKLNDRMKRAVSPLFDCFDLSDFWYSRLTNDGNLSYLGTNIAWAEHFVAEKFYLKYPFYRHPKYFRSGVVLLQNVKNEPLDHILYYFKQKFGLQVTLTFLNRIAEGFEMFTFCANYGHEMQVSMLLSEMPLLRLFTKKFREENKSFYSHLEDNQINIVDLIGPEAFWQNDLPVVQPSSVKQKFFQKMGVADFTCLSEREVDVIKLLIQGYSAGKIAYQVFLSKRTVEHHIERIKEKLGCDSKVELIQKARELELLGRL